MCQDLTQYNTAHNRQISMVGIQDQQKSRKRKSTASSIYFSEEEEVINMEDVDPTVGKFRNMVSTTIIPKVTACTWSPPQSFPRYSCTTSVHLSGPQDCGHHRIVQCNLSMRSHESNYKK